MAEDRKRVSGRTSEPSRRQVEQQSDLTATVHCPWCQQPLLVLMGVHGPFFFCGCVGHKQKAEPR